MNGTDHPPSTTAPARPRGARRALLIGVAGFGLAAGSLSMAGAAGSPSLDLEASRSHGAPTEKPGDAAASTEPDPDLVSAFADVAASPFVVVVTDPVEDPASTTTSAPTTTAAPTTTTPPTTQAPTTTAAPATTAPPTTQAPPPPPEPEPEPEPAYGDPNDPATWDRLAQCEAGGNWHINSGNGYYGGLQFSLSSWQAVGGTGYPHEHPRETQIEMGKRLHADGGWAHWPSCSRQLGYR
jgi:hypothetical protein